MCEVSNVELSRVSTLVEWWTLKSGDRSHWTVACLLSRSKMSIEVVKMILRIRCVIYHLGLAVVGASAAAIMFSSDI